MFKVENAIRIRLNAKFRIFARVRPRIMSRLVLVLGLGILFKISIMVNDRDKDI